LQPALDLLVDKDNVPGRQVPGHHAPGSTDLAM
jgi:hypothetical protein